MKCDHSDHYKCKLCGTCYQCEHKAVLNTDQWHWKCPTGKIHWVAADGNVSIIKYVNNWRK